MQKFCNFPCIYQIPIGRNALSFLSRCSPETQVTEANNDTKSNRPKQHGMEISCETEDDKNQNRADDSKQKPDIRQNDPDDAESKADEVPVKSFNENTFTCTKSPTKKGMLTFNCLSGLLKLMESSFTWCQVNQRVEDIWSLL